MRFFYLLFIGNALLQLTACGSTENLAKDDARNKVSYYEALGSNIERLVEMERGFFLHGQRELHAGSPHVWRVNQDRDSIFSVRVGVGNPHKDGFWSYWYMFASGLPNEPIYHCWEHYTQVSRDTFLKETFELKYRIPFKKLLTASLHLDVPLPTKEMFENGKKAEQYFYVRKNMTKYTGISGELVPFDIKLRESYAYRRDSFDLEPQLYRMWPVYYDHKDEVQLRKNIQHSWRLATDKLLQLYSENSSHN